jgi:amidohydrolase
MSSYPLCYNDEELTQFAYETAVSLFGEKKVHWWTPSMGGEDFAYFGQNMPSTMIRIGTCNKKKGIIHPAHSSKFNIDEAAIPIATELFTELAIRYGI